MKSDKNLSWTSYAQKYDMLLSYNPYYQRLQQQVMQNASRWEINKGDIIIDLGAGTGNYSVLLAQQFPQATIIHIDSDEGMNQVTNAKVEKLGLSNLQIRHESVEEVDFGKGTIKGIVSINALYTFPNPQKTLYKIYQWLSPEGQAILVDAGRPVNVLSWKFALAYHLFKNYGWKKTMTIMRNGKEVSRQNALIRKLQKNGVFWRHSFKEFNDAIEYAGFHIVKAYTTYRGISDLVVGNKLKVEKNDQPFRNNEKSVGV